MLWWTAWIIVGLGIGYRVLTVPWHVRWEVSGTGWEWTLEIGVGFGERPPWRRRWRIPAAKDRPPRPHPRPSGGSAGGGWGTVGVGFRAYDTLVEALFSRVTVEAVWVDATVGTGDAAVTAWLTGLVWGMIGVWLARVGPRLSGAPRFRVDPESGGGIVQGRIGSIFRLTSGDIMGALWHTGRLWAGGWRDARQTG
jgi:hypothetical protein